MVAATTAQITPYTHGRRPRKALARICMFMPAARLLCRSYRTQLCYASCMNNNLMHHLFYILLHQVQHNLSHRPDLLHLARKACPNAPLLRNLPLV